MLYDFLFFFNLSLDENAEIEQLKTSTKGLSIQMADWAKKYTADLNDVKIRLDITKRCGNQIYLETSDYRELFDEGNEPASKRRRRSRKILVRGCTGIGKTVLSKKIAVDWANEKFTAYDIIVYIPASEVTPNESIGAILIKHSGLSAETLQKVIGSNYSSLFIIDGFSSLCFNKSLMEFAADPTFNILVTESSLVKIDDMGIGFDTICRVMGFQENDAKDFFGSIGAEAQLQATQNVMVSLPSMFDPPLKNSPLLTIFMCHLIENNKLKESSAHDEGPSNELKKTLAHDEGPSNELKKTSAHDEGLSICEIHFRLVKSLSPEGSSFWDFIKRAGKLAFDHLQLGKVLTDTNVSDVFPSEETAQVSEDEVSSTVAASESTVGVTLSQADCLADPISSSLLESGLFVRHNGIISFAHSSLGIFLGALYLLLYLEDCELDESCECLRRLLRDRFPRNILMSNSLFFYFCSVLHGNQSFFPLSKRDTIRKTLSLYIRDQIDLVQLDFHDIGRLHPAFDVSLAHKKKDEFVLQYLLEILSVCRNTKEIYLGSDLPIERVLSSAKPVWGQLKRIQLGSFQSALHVNHFSIKNGGRDFNVAYFVQHKAIFNLVSLDLRILKFSDRSLSKLLSIKNKFANLETLNLIDCDLTVHDMRCLAQIGAEGSLPVTKHLDVSKNHRIYGSKHLLEFGCRWENLKSLNIENTEETSTSFDDFWHLSQKSSTGNFPVLEDLSLSTQIVDYLQKSKNLYFRNLKKLRVSSQALSPKQILHPLVHFIERKDSFGSLNSVTVRGYLAEQSQLNVSSDRQRLRAKGVCVYLETVGTNYTGWS